MDGDHSRHSRECPSHQLGLAAVAKGEKTVGGSEMVAQPSCGLRRTAIEHEHAFSMGMILNKVGKTMLLNLVKSVEEKNLSCT